MRKTIFCDIDGCLVKHEDGKTLLPDSKEKILEWIKKDYIIIFTTGRKESRRQETVEMLKAHGIAYDVLIMGLPRGPRVVINDLKPDHPDLRTAESYCIERNIGLFGIKI